MLQYVGLHEGHPEILAQDRPEQYPQDLPLGTAD